MMGLGGSGDEESRLGRSGEIIAGCWISALLPLFVFHLFVGVQRRDI